MEAQFQDAADRISGKKASARSGPAPSVSQADRLMLYSLFRQANDGDNTNPKPSMFNVKEKAKWDAWEAVKGKSKEKAMSEYIELANRIVPP